MRVNKKAPFVFDSRYDFKTQFRWPFNDLEVGQSTLLYLTPNEYKRAKQASFSKQYRTGVELVWYVSDDPEKDAKGRVVMAITQKVLKQPKKLYKVVREK